MSPARGPLASARLSFVDNARVRESAAQVVSYGGQPVTGDLRQDYLRTINLLQSLTFNWTANPAEPLLDFANDRGSKASAIVEFIADAQLSRTDWTSSSEDGRATTISIHDAMEVLASYDPDLVRSLRTLVGSLVVGEVEGFDGGSNSAIVGVIWIGLHDKRSVEEHAELLLHEFVHQAVFLEDMVHGLLKEGAVRLAEDDALVTTALQRRRRGFDKAFHSLFVATELAHFSDWIGQAERAADYRAGAVTTLKQLMERDQFLSSSGIERLMEVASMLGVASPGTAAMVE
jgi:hypothetical protein